MKMFRFVKEVFFVGLTILSSFTNAIPLNATTLSCFSMSQQECKVRPEIINVNTNNPIFFPFSIKMSRTNETRHIKWYETCTCQCILDAIVCYNKQRWNKDKCRCECKELIDKGVCDKGYAWNPSNCECECDKACNFGEYLDYENCKNIKNRTYYFYSHQISLEDFDARLLKVDKKNYKEIDIFYISYVTFKEIANCKNINSVNPLYLMINKMIGHLEEKNGNKYLALDDVNENKEVSQKYGEVWDGIKKELETINGGKKIEYGKDF